MKNILYGTVCLRKTKITKLKYLLSGGTRSCRCLHDEIRSKTLTRIKFKHGKAGSNDHKTKTPSTKEYKAWEMAKQRCFNPNTPNFECYGGRGITMCLGWKDSSINFLNAMGNRPSSKHSLDRINNNGHYSCGKCQECIQMGWPMNTRWATRIEQANNTRKSYKNR